MLLNNTVASAERFADRIARKRALEPAAPG
jgi:hypothetical protein